jgi:hypothetical protein
MQRALRAGTDHHSDHQYDIDQLATVAVQRALQAQQAARWGHDWRDPIAVALRTGKLKRLAMQRWSLAASASRHAAANL